MNRLVIIGILVLAVLLPIYVVTAASTPTKINCYNCNSKENEACSKEITTEFQPKECEGKCIVWKENGNVNRGCAKTDEECKKGVCCNEDKCNSHAYFECYQCDDCDGADDKNLTVCEVGNDECYINLNDKNKVARGCSSISKDLCKNNEKCKACKTSGCNNDKGEKDPQLKCIQCDDNDKCPSGGSQNNGAPCKTKVQFWQTEQCFSYRADKKVSRGCVLDSETCSKPQTQGCDLCDKENCNNQNYVEISCYTCHSANAAESNCTSDKPEGLKSKKCEVANNETRGCYTRRHDNYVIRGCLSDLDADQLQECKKDNKKCITCDENNCNDKKAPSRASSAVLSVFVVIATMIIKRLV